MAEDHRAYFRQRAAEEQDAAAQASCIVRDVHLEMAELYADCAKPAFPPAGDEAETKPA